MRPPKMPAGAFASLAVLGLGVGYFGVLAYADGLAVGAVLLVVATSALLGGIAGEVWRQRAFAAFTAELVAEGSCADRPRNEGDPEDLVAWIHEGTVSLEDAKAAALSLARQRYTNREPADEIVIEDDRTISRNRGWLFRIQSSRYLETDSFDAMLVGAQPIFVHRKRGDAMFVGSEGPTDHEILGKPEPDWPSWAWLTMIAAVASQAVVWLAGWVLHEAIVWAFGFVALTWIAALVVAYVAVRPTSWLVDATGFRNVRWTVPVAVVGLGNLGGELLFAAYVTHREVPELSWLQAASLVRPFFEAQSADYLLLHAITFTIMVGVAATIGDWRNDRRLWNEGT